MTAHKTQINQKKDAKQKNTKNLYENCKPNEHEYEKDRGKTVRS